MKRDGEPIFLFAELYLAATKVVSMRAGDDRKWVSPKKLEVLRKT
jgi:hypothetical protein